MAEPRPYRALLDATIAHLETLRAQGTQFVAVKPETLAALARPPRRTGSLARGRTAAGGVARPAGAAAPAAVRPQAPATMAGVPGATACVSDAGAVQATVPKVASPPPLVLDLGGRMPAPAEKEAAMASLRQRALGCRQCEHLANSRTQVVFGVGSVHAQLMFVGEAPGADEDAQGEPFVGKAGQLLTRIIQTMGLSRETVYIGNILKCRPDTPGQAAGNRKPTPSEMVTCIPYLLEQIRIIQPKVLVALGATAVEGLIGKSEGITRIRGQWREFHGIPLMPTYHPAYLLRNQALSEKRKVWEDMLQVMERLGMSISEKQRGYFLKGG